MSTQTVVFCALMLALLTADAAWAEGELVQVPAPPLIPVPAAESLPSVSEMQPVAEVSDPAAEAEVSDPGHSVSPSAWITYSQPGCCGPVGRDGPI